MMRVLLAILLLALVLAPAGAAVAGTLRADARNAVSGIPVAEPLSAARDDAADTQVRLAQGTLPTIDRPVRPRDTAIATRRANGHFVFDAEINGVTVPVVFDTGASLVTLRAEDAGHMGINTATLNYSMHTSTANGIAEAAPAVIATLKIGTITRTNVAAVVARPGALAVNLLGQSFLTTMAGFVMDGDRLVLRGN
jgi:clan AA aspartic protease (TIGR02281 family)